MEKKKVFLLCNKSFLFGQIRLVGLCLMLSEMVGRSELVYIAKENSVAVGVHAMRPKRWNIIDDNKLGKRESWEWGNVTVGIILIGRVRWKLKYAVNVAERDI